MSLELNLQSIKTRIETARAAWTDYTLKVEYGNLDLVALADQVDPYLAVDIEYFDGQQLDLGSSPLTADYGSIIIAAGVKEGAGTARLLKLLDHFRPYLQMQDSIGAVRTRAATVQKGVPRMGFWFIPMVIPFWTVEVAPLPGQSFQQVLDGGAPNSVYASVAEGGAP